MFTDFISFCSQLPSGTSLTSKHTHLLTKCMTSPKKMNNLIKYFTANKQIQAATVPTGNLFCPNAKIKTE